MRARTGGPILEVHDLDASRVGFDPGDRVRAGFLAGADIQLQDEFLGRIGGDDLNDALAVVQLGPLGLVIVVARAQAVGFQLFDRGGELLAETLPTINSVVSPGALARTR